MRGWLTAVTAVAAAVVLLLLPGRADPAPAARWVWPAWPAPQVRIDPATGLDQAAVEAEVTAIVQDPRGWRQNLSHLTVLIVVPGSHGTEPMPGTVGRATGQLAVISAQAWTDLGPLFAAAGGDLQDQRTWILLHEIGHLLGHKHTDPVCPGGGPAPIMRPTNYKLGDGCDLGVWPTSVEQLSPGQRN